MRAVCCICSDLFENSAAVGIAAVQCGHTFHTECLMKWLDTAGTCPQCRIRINPNTVIRKLFFDDGGENDKEDVDSDKLKNELTRIKLKLSEKQKEKNDIIDERDNLMTKAIEAEKSKKDMESLFRQEQTMNNLLKKQLQSFHVQQKSLEAEKHEWKMSKEKLTTLQDMETILKGCESDAHDVFERNSGGSDRRLSTYCAILKREYEQIKSDKKSLKDHFDKMKRDLIDKTRLLQIQGKDFNNLTEMIKRSEEDLKQAEKEKDIFRQKLSHLKRAIRSPCPSASSSFVETLMEESPVQSSTTHSAKLSNVEIDLDCSDVIPSTPEIIKSQSMTRFKRPLEEKNIKCVRISSSLEPNPPKKTKKESNDVTTFTPIGGFNIFKKKSGVGDYESVVRKGYDGLGGHTTFSQHQGKLKPLMKKASSHGSKLIIKGKKLPPFPRLDEFI